MAIQQTPPSCRRDALRVFLSYSHEDHDLAVALAGILDEVGLITLYDKMIRPGSAFTDAIKGMISHAHIFMPLITANSQSRSWVHQEIGYAMALNIPVLPVSTADSPGEMIAQFQAIHFAADDLTGLREALQALDLENLVRPRPDPLKSIIELADWPETRAETMARSARRVLEMGYHGRLYQRSGLSSFSIPDVDVEDDVWVRRDGDNPRGDYYHDCLREERRQLEVHARACGCDLMIDPQAAVAGDNPLAKTTRLEILAGFLESLPVDCDVRVVCSDIAKQANTTIIGEWVSAETRLHSPRGGWRQTIFNWHAPTVRQTREKFSVLFDELLVKQFGRQDVDPLATRQAALQELQRQKTKIQKET